VVNGEHAVGYLAGLGEIPKLHAYWKGISDANADLLMRAMGGPGQHTAIDTHSCMGWMMPAVRPARVGLALRWCNHDTTCVRARARPE
jgi:hypothetical protein